jgi:hypothetical protein
MAGGHRGLADVVGYVEGHEYKSGTDMIAFLVDVVSKNGRLLLNVGPKADGTGGGGGAVRRERITRTWELAIAPAIIPIPRASRSASIRDFAAAADLELIADQFALPSV